MSKFFIEKTDSSKVKKFWQNSPHNSAFTNPEILSLLHDSVHWWKASKGDVPMCFWPTCIDNKLNMVLPNFFYYFGPFWTEEYLKIKPNSWLALSTKIYEGFIENFLKNYKSIHSQLPLGLDDIRIFDWWNFNSNNKNRFKINTKYTAIINNLDKLSISEIKSGFRYWRRNEYNRINKNISSLEKDNICDLDELYKLYLDITSADTHDLKSNFKLMLDLNKKNFADFIIFRDKENKKIASLIFLLYGKREANVVLNLTSAAWKKKGLSVLSVIESIKIAKKNKKKIFDFNGANSPNRGDDKHSYGAVPKLFFELKYNG